MPIPRLAVLWALVVCALFPLSVSAQELFTNTPSATASLDPGATPTPGVPPIPSGAILIDVPIPDALRQDGAGFEIVAMSVERTLHTIERVTLTIENTGESSLGSAAWYLLTPAWVTEDAWKYASYTAPTQIIEDLPQGEQVVLNFLGPTDGLIGEFKLSGWVHRLNEDGTTSHADGIGFDIPIVLGPPLFLTVDHVEIFPVPGGTVDQQVVYVTMTLRNYSPQFAEVAYSFSLALPGTEKPWENGIFNLPYQSLILLPGSEVQLTTRDILSALPAEGVEVTGFLQQNIRGTYEFRSSYLFPVTVLAVAGANE
ncbi:MAG: hypothetical protein L6Q98_04560 [Anaerolineae bacterium]|nr:hypothetical protein [Anaerolineae bacterium]NUQ03518.1 hypothetical protein [Anaerolineae bacterium]